MAQPLYSTSFNITHFSGLNQSGDGYNMNMQYAREMENVNISGGSFKPMREGDRLEQVLHGPIGTLAYLNRRYGQDTGTLLVAISEGRVFTKVLDGNDEWVQRYPSRTTTTTTETDEEADEDASSTTVTKTVDGSGRITITTVTVAGTTTTTVVVAEVEAPLAVYDNDWVTYEISLYPTFSSSSTYAKGQRVQYRAADTDPWKNYKAKADISTAESWTAAHWDELTGTDPVDILLFSNATDGMFCLYGDTLDVAPVETPKKFGVLARYNERIWGSGITGDPDMLVYSVPYDPFDWSQNNEIPEDGAGDILQPTWDGDSFIGLKQYGSTLMAIKRNSIWRISGTDPGEFTIQQMYGGGTINENTVAVYNDSAFMLGEYGMLQHSGSGAFPFRQEETQDIFRKELSREYSAPEYSENRSYWLGELASHNGSIYRCNTKINTTPQTDGTLAGEEWTAAHWDAVTGTPTDNVCAGMWNGVYCLAIPIRGSSYCNAILQYDTVNRTISLRTGVSVDSFLQINERLLYTSGTFPGEVFELDDDKGKVLPIKWVSGYQDLGQKNSIKSAFTAYMMVECEAPVELYLGIRTEKKFKEKRVNVKPGKMVRINLNTHGREFRFEIRSYQALPYVIAGGVKVELELDPD